MMRQLLYEIRAHRRVAILFALTWVGIWAISAMIRPEAVGLRHFLLVVVASVVIGWWRMPETGAWSPAHINDSIKYGLLAAVVVMEIDLVIIWIMDRLAAPASVSSTAPWWGPVAGVVAFFLGFGLIAGVAGMFGGLLGGALAYAVHWWRRRGGPAAPADMP